MLVSDSSGIPTWVNSLLEFEVVRLFSQGFLNNFTTPLYNYTFDLFLAFSYFSSIFVVTFCLLNIFSVSLDLLGNVTFHISFRPSIVIPNFIWKISDIYRRLSRS